MTLRPPAPARGPAPTPAGARAATGALDALAPTYKRMAEPFVRGQGVFLYDAEGKGYLDFASGIAVNALGYGDPGVARAISEALETGLIHVSNLYRTAPGERLAAELVRRSFADHVFFCNSGAESVEGAFKFARKWARANGGAAKHEIVALRGSFHGRLFASVAATDRPAYRLPFRPLAGGISIAERDERELDAVLQEETVAALIVEPIQGEGGVRVIEPGMLHYLRCITQERGIALIFDEIQCGLGRTGTLFAYEQAGIEPDIMTLAKPLAGGLPMGAILLRESIGSAMQPGDHGTTFGGGPLVASVALHVLERLADPAFLAHVRDVGTWMGGALREVMSRTGKFRAVRGHGLMWGVDVPEPAAGVVARARDAGLLVVTAGEHTLRLLPPLVLSRDEGARGLEILESVL
ncbi:MAG: acetylornithine transaminase [Gemmatimonadetes bacterium]|nr:acetylornithine transaminase [Gemmatimonadota bacterium]